MATAKPLGKTKPRTPPTKAKTAPAKALPVVPQKITLGTGRNLAYIGDHLFDDDDVHVR